MNHIQNRWSKSKNDVPNFIRSYFTHQQDLTYSNGFIFEHLLHVGHLGIVKIKEKACDIMHWSSINAGFQKIVNSCDTCQEYQNQLKNKSPITHNIATTPWTKVGADLLE